MMHDSSSHVYVMFPSNSFLKEIFAHWEVCLQKEELSLSSLLVESGVRINGKKPTLQCFFFRRLRSQVLSFYL